MNAEYICCHELYRLRTYFANAIKTKKLILVLMVDILAIHLQ